jgi:hypothetical protein
VEIPFSELPLVCGGSIERAGVGLGAGDQRDEQDPACAESDCRLYSAGDGLRGDGAEIVLDFRELPCVVERMVVELSGDGGSTRARLLTAGGDPGGEGIGLGGDPELVSAVAAGGEIGFGLIELCDATVIAVHLR